jgi:hypothetical protein
MNIALGLNICEWSLMFINLISIVSLFQRKRDPCGVLIYFSNREMKTLKEYWNIIGLSLPLGFNIGLKVKELEV